VISRLAELARPALAFLKRHKLAVRLVVVSLVAFFLLRGLVSGWSGLRSYSWHVSWPLLALALLLLIGQELSFAFVWRFILRRMGFSLGALTAQRIYLGSEMVRYIPGNVWHVITRVVWAERHGVPRAQGFTSMVVELATKIASAALVFVATLFFWPDARVLASTLPRGVLAGMAIVGTPLLLVGLHPRIMSAALNAGLRVLKREPVNLPFGYADVLAITLAWCASWGGGGLGFWLLLAAVSPGALPAAAPTLAVGIFALAWDIGFLSLITPSGLGVREWAIAALLVAAGLVGGGAAGVALATVVALLARLLTTASELLCIAGANLAPSRERRP
jgi:glycosyltransferase 2 family protein